MANIPPHSLAQKHHLGVHLYRQGSLIILLVGAIHVSKVSSVKYPVANDRYSRWDKHDQREKKVGYSWC